MSKRRERLVERKVIRKRKQWTEYKKRKNRHNNSRKKSPKRKRKKAYFKTKEKVLKVPKNYSLITNMDGVLAFAASCKTLDNSDYSNLYLDFTDVEEISPGSMALTLSIIHDLKKSSDITVRGNVPRNKQAAEIFTQSGFLDFFKVNIPITKKTENAILVQGSNKVDQIRASKQIFNAMNTVFGKSISNKKIQGMIIELMANTVNHAYLDNKKNARWYLSVFHDKESNVAKFLFIDNGEGIINTISIRMKGIKELLGQNLLQKAFEGEYGSRTKLKIRGQGLKMIKNCFTHNNIKNLKVITNDYYYDFNTEDFTRLHSEFSGTLYYWELDKTCLYA